MNFNEFENLEEQKDQEDNINISKKSTKIKLNEFYINFIKEFKSKPIVYYISQAYTLFYLSIIMLIIINPILNSIESVSKSQGFLTFDSLKIALVAILTVEFSIRFIVCPKKLKFFISFFNIVDIMFIVPYYLNQIFPNNQTINDINDLTPMFRVLLILKVFRRSKNLNILLKTLGKSIREIVVYILYVSLGTVLFGSIVFNFENSQPDTQFITMPTAFW